jgi:hypothetical protein
MSNGQGTFFISFKCLESLARPVQTSSSIAYGHVNTFYIRRKVTESAC